MEEKLNVGDTLRETFAIYRDQAGVLLPVAFWLFLAAAVVEALTLDVLALFWIGTVVSLTVGTLYQGMVVAPLTQFWSRPATARATRSPRGVSVYSVWGGRPGMRWRSTIPAASSCSSRSDSVVGETPGRDWRNSLKRAAPLEQA
jgi:hypothetical protein